MANGKIHIVASALLFALLLFCFCGCATQQAGKEDTSSSPAVSSPLPVEEDDTDIEMQEVDSSCFSEVGYDADQELLLVRFLDSSSLYSYEPISEEEYDTFVGADSLGSYYNEYIKGNYECHRLE